MSQANLSKIGGDYIYYPLTDTTGAPTPETNIASWPALAWDGSESWSGGDGVQGNGASFLATGQNSIVDNLFKIDPVGGILIAFWLGATDFSSNLGTQGVFTHAQGLATLKGIRTYTGYNSGTKSGGVTAPSTSMKIDANGDTGVSGAQIRRTNFKDPSFDTIYAEHHHAFWIFPTGNGDFSMTQYYDGNHEGCGEVTPTNDASAFLGKGLVLMGNISGGQAITNLMTSGVFLLDFLAVRTTNQTRSIDKLVKDLSIAKRQFPTSVGLL